MMEEPVCGNGEHPHRARRDELATKPGDDPTSPELGVFSTRSPARPNPVGATPRLGSGHPGRQSTGSTSRSDQRDTAHGHQASHPIQRRVSATAVGTAAPPGNVQHKTEPTRVPGTTMRRHGTFPVSGPPPWIAAGSGRGRRRYHNHIRTTACHKATLSGFLANDLLVRGEKIRCRRNRHPRSST